MERGHSRNRMEWNSTTSIIDFIFIYCIHTLNVAKYYPGRNETWMGASSLLWACRLVGCPHPVVFPLVGFNWPTAKPYGVGVVLLLLKSSDSTSDACSKQMKHEFGFSEEFPVGTKILKNFLQRVWSYPKAKMRAQNIYDDKEVCDYNDDGVEETVEESFT